MFHYSVLIVGKGGQGIIKAGTVLGRAALLYENKYAVQILSYGPEARGTACKSLVKISDEFIEIPFTDKVECLIAMSQDAYQKYCHYLREDGVLIYDPEFVKPKFTGQAYPVRATSIAESLGARICANMVMLGAFSAITGAIRLESLEAAVKDIFKGPVVELNLKALHEGWKAGMGAMERARSPGV